MRLAAGGAVALGLGGCAAFPALDLEEAAPPGPRSVALDTPFHPQTDYQCGPAALAGVLGATGVEVSPGALAPQVYLPERQGSLQVELLAATRRAGRVAYRLGQDPSELLAELAGGRPVLVLQNLGTRAFPTWHYAVLTGYDLAANELVLDSGVTDALRTPAGRFLRTWDWAGRWAMVALRPGELPARPDPARYAEAAAAFERSGEAAAVHAAWAAAAAHWPGDPRPPLALGNLAYAAGDREGALALYAAGHAASPGDPALANNLAAVLGELGCAATGHALLSGVSATIEAGSPWRTVVDGTLHELASLGADTARHCAARVRGQDGDTGAP